MGKFIVTLFVILLAVQPAFCGIVQGGVEKQMVVGRNKVVDTETNAPIGGAKISLPQEGFQTYTNPDGTFAIDANITGKTVLSVEKQGYKPFSITIDQKSASRSLVMGIEKATPKDITIETEMFHLGDNNYSDNSANARDFQVKTIGPYYSKKVKIPTISPGTKVTLIVGSIIGVDTQMAKSMGQNKVNNTYASPPEVYFNGNKIAEIQLNGDGQKIRVPYNIIKQNQMNEITIKTGRNMMQTAYVDYDDIEFMNLTVETR